MLKRLMLMQVYMGCWLMSYLCRFLVELVMVVGLCPMNCSLNHCIIQDKYVLNSPQGEQ